MARDPASDRPWEALPPELARVLRPELPALADEILEAIRDGVADYQRPLEGPFGLGLRSGVEGALGQFMQMIERPGGGPAGHEAYERLGRGEMLAGRTLDALLAAYRLGARVAWRRLAASGVRAGLDPEVLYLLAESIFAYIDELSAASVEGYTAEQSAAAGEAQRRRRRLVGLLVQEPAADPLVVEAAAAEAGWELPRSLAVLAMATDEPERVGARLGTAVIAAPLGDLFCVLVPDPQAPRRRHELEAGLDGARAAIGPAVPWPEAALSLERATATWRLLEEGTIRGPGLVAAADHMATLLMQSDRGLARDLAAMRLAALAGLPERSRAVLTETLLAWLAHQGRLKAVAGALHVHEQTVRYRMAQLREVLGSQLDDPDARFDLELALRAAAVRDQSTNGATARST